MKKRMKQLLSLTLALAMLLVCMAGCGNNTTPALSLIHI